jgi:hypothetical protein
MTIPTTTTAHGDQLLMIAQAVRPAIASLWPPPATWQLVIGDGGPYIQTGEGIITVSSVSRGRKLMSLASTGRSTNQKTVNDLIVAVLERLIRIRGLREPLEVVSEPVLMVRTAQTCVPIARFATRENLMWFMNYVNHIFHDHFGLKPGTPYYRFLVEERTVEAIKPSRGDE